MENRDAQVYAADAVDRLWRAYLPFRRGRSIFGDLPRMLAILVLARFVETTGEPGSELVRRWKRAVTEARSGASPLVDLRAAMQDAGMNERFPVPDLLPARGRTIVDDGAPEDMPWAAAFLAELDKTSPLTEAEAAQVCDLLLERHVKDNPFSAGEFYTPRGVGDLMVRLTSPQAGDRILDPACGTGGILAAAAQRIAQSGRVDEASFEAYATDHSNVQLAKMNMVLHGVERPVVQAGDPLSLYQDKRDSRVDRVLGNPPFNQRIDRVDMAHWPFGTPPRANANFLWLQLAWSRLSDDGIAAMVMPAGAAFHSGRAATIRKEMLTGGALLGVIALPANLFQETSIPVHVWLLARDKSRHLSAGAENTVLFIDASSLGTQAPRQPRTLAAEDVDKICGRFVEWLRSPWTTFDEPGFSRAVTHEEVLRNAGDLNPRRYVAVERKEPERSPDFSRLLSQLDRATTDSSAEIRETFGAYEQLVRTRSAAPRVPLQSVINSSTRVLPEGKKSGRILAGPSGSLLRAGDYRDDGVPVVMPRDLTDDGFSTTNIRYVPADKAQGLDRFRLQRGDIVLARRGELGRCAVVRDEQQGWVCGTGCFILRLPSAIDAEYLSAYLRSPEAREWLDAHSTGSINMKTISLDVLGNLPIVVPDLETQRAIATMMTRLDDHKRVLQAQLELMQELRHEALEGILKN
ncbi:N-6 DNA methylase [Actinomadura madurae]|uniref:N-6 DNA methylase n=1 Tax=Actinomadura madurae TaxID=1993 RepID=UPI003999B685